MIALSCYYVIVLERSVRALSWLVALSSFSGTANLHTWLHQLTSPPVTPPTKWFKFLFIFDTKHITFNVLHRPPPSRKNKQKLTESMFLDQFSDLHELPGDQLCVLVTSTCSLISLTTPPRRSNFSTSFERSVSNKQSSSLRTDRDTSLTRR